MNVLYNLRSLSSAKYQAERWIRRERFGSFGEVIHALFDDSGFDNGTRNSIGRLLFDEEEADGITGVMGLIDNLFAKYGKRLSDAEYIAKPEWPAIMEAAREALEIMKRNDARFMISQERQQLYSDFNIEF
jgi:hypothetical protein